MKINPMLLIDFYKADHRRQYPVGTELVYSNFTPRKSRVEGTDHMIFFGLQYAVQEYLLHKFNEDFFARDRSEVVREYQTFMDATLGDGVVTAEHIGELHDLQYLPLHIKALKEGTRVPLQTPALTMWNTHPRFFWLTNYLETLLSALLWKPCTSATTAVDFYEIFEKFTNDTGADKEFIKFQGHDFSFRGMSGVEDALMSGAGHLLSFVGTDTVPAIRFLENYYGADIKSELVGCSVPATEHSVMCAGGAESEMDTLKRLLHLYPSGIVSVVSDTWDLFRLVDNYLPQMKEQIMGRDGKLVIRPDSGIPNKILNGDPDGGSELEKKGVVRILDEHFGSTENELGYRTLDPHVGTIYGDGINREELVRILSGLKHNGYTPTNTVIGLGSYTYEYVTRDTFGTVCKATYVEVNNTPRPIFKDPKTGAWKKSHKGLLAVNPDLSVSQNVSWDDEGGIMEDVFVNGKMKRFQSLSEIREIVKNQP